MKIVAPYRFSVEIAVRDQLGLCNDYYAVASVIEFICNDPENKERAAGGDYRKVVAKCAGISERTAQRGIEELIKKGLIEKYSRQKVKITQKWYQMHGKITEFNSCQNGTSEKEDKNSTRANLSSHSCQNGTSVYIYTNKTIKYTQMLPHLRNFETSFLEEKKDSQKQTISQNSQKIANGAAADFDVFWMAYPRKKDKKRAASTWKRVAKPLGLEKIMAALDAYKAEITAKGTAADFIIYPSTFLNRIEEWMPLETMEPQKIANGAAANSDKSASAEFAMAMAKISKLSSKLIGGDITSDQLKAANPANVEADGKRLFNQLEIAWIEAMGGLKEIVIAYTRDNFERNAKAAWLDITRPRGVTAQKATPASA